MGRLTLKKLNQGLTPGAIGMCVDDPRYLKIVNSATERLLQKGLWWATTAAYSICTDKACITWPRQFAAIESIWVCGVPLTLRGQWFEYLQSGIGLQGNNCRGGNCGNGPIIWSGWNWLCWGGNVLFRENACTFADIIGVNKKIKVYCDVAESAGAKILLMGYDENKIWIRSPVGDGTYFDGEYVDLNAAVPQTTTHFFSSLTSVQKPQTNGNVRLYEYDTDLTTQRAMAIYEPTEENPSYRRSYIPGICCRNEDDDSCRLKPVGVIAKLAFIPVQNETDYLVIENETAIQLMAQAINFELNSVSETDTKLALSYEGKAVAELNAQLRHQKGSSVVQPVRMSGMNAAAVPNLI